MTHKMKKKFLMDVDGFKVYSVDGEWVRNNKEISFTMGSHHKVSPYIPKGELWLDDTMKKLDRKALIIHEKVEADLMNTGMSYPKAHARAEKVEAVVRS